MNKPYDLEDRTLEFGGRVIRLCKSLPFDEINKKLIGQLIRSGTSVGANYREAKETIYWLELVVAANRELEDKILPLLDESRQIMRILASIYDKSVNV